jgi:hypothetical protein
MSPGLTFFKEGLKRNIVMYVENWNPALDVLALLGLGRFYLGLQKIQHVI